MDSSFSSSSDKDTWIPAVPEEISVGVDLVSSAISLLHIQKTVSGLPHLHEGPFIIQAIRRYLNYWMPLAAESLTNSKEELLPPVDVHWVWLCHCLNPRAYLHYCNVHYSRIIDVPLLLDITSERSARARCKLLWNKAYPYEPFDLNISQKTSPANFTPQRTPTEKCANLVPATYKLATADEKEIMESISQQSTFFKQVLQPYMYHLDFLKLAKSRYMCFLYMLMKLKGKGPCIPTADIQVMWRGHQISPVAYARDTKSYRLVENYFSSLRFQSDSDVMQAFEHTSRTWEMLFGHPYERAGAVCQQVITSDLNSVLESIPITINWHHQITDSNSKHKYLDPRYVVEVCVHVKNTQSSGNLGEEADDLFVRMRMMESCKSFQQDIPVQSFQYDMIWHKLWGMQCEVSSEGFVLELRSHRPKCFGVPCMSRLLGQSTFTWKELESETPLARKKPLPVKKRCTISEDWVFLTSITPPVQAPYLLKALPDHVTDDNGAMISKKITRWNKHKPQEGRWISKTVLNHAGKECFIIRIRVAAGAWRKVERPVGVDWNERIIHIHGGGWKYISGSLGIAPDEILATARPVADELEQYKMKWELSTGETLTVQMPIENLNWERCLRFSLKGTTNGVVRLLNGRHMQYEVPSTDPYEEEGFVTVVRYTADARQGRATALFNWKLSSMEVLPEEDVVLMMLLCTATQRSVADLGGRVARSSYRRRKTRKSSGIRDWGAVVLAANNEYVPPELMFWYVNPEDVLEMDLDDVENEVVLPTGASYNQIYRGTSWLYAGSSKGLYKLSSRGSSGSIGGGVGDDYLCRLASLTRLGSQTKVSQCSH